MMYLRLYRFAAVVLALALAGCGSSEDGDAGTATTASGPRMETIRGTLSYAEEIVLAPESMVTVQLLEFPTAGGAPAVIAESVFQYPGKAPVPFALSYDAETIEPDRQYALRAEVKEQKRLMFVSNTGYPVLRDGHQPPVDILLKHVPGGHLERMAENVRANNPELSGYYRYFDGHGEFVDCSDGSSHPLAREHGIYALESEYRDVAPRYGDEVFVRLAGKYVTRPARNGRGKEDYLVVLQLEEMDADGDCP